jgi:hypothetical protein
VGLGVNIRIVITLISEHTSDFSGRTDLVLRELPDKQEHAGFCRLFKQKNKRKSIAEFCRKAIIDVCLAVKMD